MRRLPRQLLAVSVCLLVLCINGCHRGPNKGHASAGGDASIERVTVGKPQRKTLVRTTTQPARIEAFEQTPLFAKLAGFVKEVHVDIGDPVSVGQPLITLNIPELLDDVAQKSALVTRAAADVEQAVANVKALQAAVASAQAKIAEARAGVTRAKAELDRWQAEYERIRQLSDSGSVTQKLRDETFNQLQAATAARDEAEAAVTSAEASAAEAAANVDKSEADVVAAEAQLKVAQAELARARTLLSYAEICSPFDGVVTQRSVDTGHFVQPAGGAGAIPLLVVARIDKVRIFLDVPEMEAGLVDVGDKATISVQALSGKTVESTVVRTSWSLDARNRSLRAEVDVANDGAQLRPGMYALGTIELDRRTDVLVLPTPAINHDVSGDYCWVVVSDAVDRRHVELGLRSGAEVEVRSGIDQDSLVVLARGELLAKGQKVQVALAAQ
jgi:HlyD family secretion protein